MKYLFHIIHILILLVMVPSPATAGTFDLHRTTDPGTVRTSTVFASSTASPYNDMSGSLSNGQTYFYLVRENSSGVFADVTVDKDRANDRVVASFTDPSSQVGGTVFDEEFQVNVSAEGDQIQPSAGQSTNGGLVTIWTGQDVDGAGIFGRVFNADGSLAVGEFIVNTNTTGDQTNPDVAVAADRRFVVVWESADADGSGIYAQLYDANGLPVGGETRVNIAENGSQVNGDVVMADDGSYVVVWQGPDFEADGVYARMFDAFGQPISAEFLVNAGDEADSQHDPRAAITGDGRFVVLWQSTVPGRDGIYAQLYNSLGGPVGTAIDVYLGMNGQEGTPKVAMSDTGGFAAVWQGDDGAGLGVVARSFDATGLSFTPSEVLVNTTTNGKQNEPDVAMAADGACIVVWHDHSNAQIHAQLLDPSMAALGSEFLVSNPTHNKPDSPAVSLAGDGSSYLILYEADDGDGRGVFASWVPLM